MAALLIMGGSWFLVSTMGSPAELRAAERAHNTRVLAEAKAALIGWVAANAMSDDNPGRLPCPQAWGDVGGPSDGRAAGNCASPVGWLPWRTLGIPKLLDASGNQLWYAVSPGWHLPNSTASLTINSNTAGALSVDGSPVVAVIIASGPSLRIEPTTNQLSAGCVARSQSSAINLPGTAPDPRDFLECQNGSTSDNTFTSSVVDNGINPVFNDQVLSINAADVLPGLEAAIAKRIELEIVPQLRLVYATADWGLDTTNPVFPFAAPFGHPGPGAGTSDYQGVAGTFQGLLPFNQIRDCTPSASDPRCTSTLLAFSKATPETQTGGGGSIRTLASCSWQSSNTIYVCTGQYNQPTVSLNFSFRVTNVAMGLRSLDLAKVTCSAVDDVGNGLPLQNVPCSASVAIQSDGAAIVAVAVSSLPDINSAGWGTYANYSVSVERAAFVDHALLNPVDPPDQTPAGSCLVTGCTGWFVRNEWFRLIYYALAEGHAASGAAPRSCDDTTPTCLQVVGLSDGLKQRAVVTLTGRSLFLASQTRPSPDQDDYLELTENRNGDALFVQAQVNPRFNDRFISVDKNP